MKLDDWKFWGLASLTLGLAPFFPEPHIWGKVKWIAGGAVGMSAMDWFDVVLHGTPWLMLVVALIKNVISGNKKTC
ncbi:MAG: hypothetical protein CL840_14175 [Crocinitomicaceae bacterium]|nr:hypothetical protein [Crocinitomicaceae bacterium]|tara:strand:+ start:640 stop:867 length:228 start_codon:yes stop_codon:yes gene_type:complete